MEIHKLSVSFWTLIIFPFCYSN